MAIKSVVEEKLEGSEFPKLMVSGSLIVLMLEPKIGISLADGDEAHPCGEYSSGWNMRLFKDFHGEVTLSNE